MAQTLEQQIRRVIKQHYGEELWSFRQDVDYRDATKAFVADVAVAIKGEINFARDLPSEIARYGKGGSSERIIGREIRKMRVKRGVSHEQLAAKLGFNPEFLEALEAGRICAAINIFGDAYNELNPTKKEIEEFGVSIARYLDPEEVIRDVIEIYYGISLWSFKPDVSYDEAIEPFVKSLTALR